MKIKWKLLNRIARFLGYRNVFFELDGIVMCVGNKYNDKGWYTFSLRFKTEGSKAKYFKGQIQDIYVVKGNHLSKKEILKHYRIKE